MLSDRSKQEILDIAGRHEHRRAACIEALRIAQQENRWISREVLLELAAILEMTPEEIEHLATFYNLIFRSPVGRHVIMMCDSISCMIAGYEPLAAYMQERFGIGFGETSSDGRFTLIPVACLGNCDRAPALIIDSDTYGSVGTDTIASILEKYP